MQPLERLLELVDKGVEYPDAEYKVQREFKLYPMEVERLREDYDKRVQVPESPVRPPMHVKQRFEVGIGFQLNSIQREKANRWLNKHYAGKETPAPDDPSTEHKDAAWRVSGCYRATITVEMHEDGSLHIVDVEGKYPL